MQGKFAASDGRTMPDCARAASSLEAGGGVGTPLVGIAVDTLIGAISNELAARKAGRNATWPASGAADGIVGDQDYCLALSRGLLTSTGSSPALPDGLGFSGTPAFVLLADFHITAVDASWRAILKPVYLGYAETAAPRRGTGRKQVSVILSFQPQGPAPKDASWEAGGAAAAGSLASQLPDALPAGTVQLDFGRLNIGQAYGSALLGTVSAGTTLQPSGQYTVTALVSESDDADAALEAFSQAFDKNKDSLSAALKDVVARAVSEKSQ